MRKEGKSMTEKKIYADNAATTALEWETLQHMLPYLSDCYGNPSGAYPLARSAAKAVEEARGMTAKCINAAPDEIYFTSGGTEADNWVLRSTASIGAKNGKRHIVSTKFEHHAVLHTLEALSKHGFDVTYVDIPPDGVVRPSDVLAALQEDTCLVTVMLVNNEVGTIQPVAEIGKLCRERGIVFHTDAVQAAGHIPIDVRAMNIDMLSISAHKFHGPKGIGALYCRNGVGLENLMYGGAQERGKRPSTENVAGIVGLAYALSRACKDMEYNTRKILPMRERLIEGLSKIQGSHINGNSEHCLCGTVSFCFEGIDGESLVFMLGDMCNIYASSGSACTTGSLEPSHVLLAMGVPPELARGSLRLSVNEYNTLEEMDIIVREASTLVALLRRLAPD